jgi:hypothetical protein
MGSKGLSINEPSSGVFDIRKWVSEHGKIATTRNIKTGKIESPGIDMTALQKREGAAGVDKTWPFAKVDSGRGYTFDELFQELKAEGFQGTIDDAAEMLESQMTKGPKTKAEKELYEYFGEMGKGIGEEVPIAGKEGAEFVAERDLRKIQKAIFDLNDLIEGTSQEAAHIAPSSKKVLNRDLEMLKKELLASIEKVSPEFAKANKLYEKMSPPIDRLKSSVIGELTRMRSDKAISGAIGKVLDVSNMPDPELLRRAKTVIQKKDPELWKEMVGSYVRDVFESLRVTEDGHVVNAAGKLYKRLYGGKQGEIMKAALEGLPQEQTFKELMEIYQKAAVGYSRESMTAQFQQIGKGLEGQLGTTAYQLAKAPKDTVVEWTLGKWNDMWMSGRQKKLLDALTSPEVIDKLKKLKPLPPGSKKFIESFSVFTAFVSDRYIEGTP